MAKGVADNLSARIGSLRRWCVADNGAFPSSNRIALMIDSNDEAQHGRAYAVVASAIRFLESNQKQQPGLADIASHVGLSEFHLQRLFCTWAGVSPRQYLQYLTKESAKRRLRLETVFNTALSVGLSGPGRLHDLMVTCEGVTPGEYRLAGQGLAIAYGIHDSPFGACLLASTGNGICKLAFFDTQAECVVLEGELFAEWPAATITRQDAITALLLPRMFPVAGKREQPLKLLLRGSPFQLKVWEALLAIPVGGICTYQQVANLVESPAAVRAVASAIAQNSIGYLIPCHRVIRAGGEFGQYRWGGTRKKAMLAWEASVVDGAPRVDGVGVDIPPQ